MMSVEIPNLNITSSQEMNKVPWHPPELGLARRLGRQIFHSLRTLLPGGAPPFRAKTLDYPMAITKRQQALEAGYTTQEIQDLEDNFPPDVLEIAAGLRTLRGDKVTIKK